MFSAHVSIKAVGKRIMQGPHMASAATRGFEHCCVVPALHQLICASEPRDTGAYYYDALLPACDLTIQCQPAERRSGHGQNISPRHVSTSYRWHGQPSLMACFPRPAGIA